MNVGDSVTSSVAGVKFVYRCIGMTLDGTPIVHIESASEEKISDEHKPKRNKNRNRSKGA